ncbi:UDP-2,3-diacylglucosamine hydrolase [Marinospirillum celere]|uniref:UDP-2,3-diacylglucosamine hydrolase n=1 Tax=Marinospirillum celere TaxID=1122252 RepID=A0A1I1DRU4_9GAMM|nr:UDP-2,3-diacylglucosamine diphosphatase [Marinospirillum celere]SFB77564.1 UDP-2,3-diacylglucosamine hydrolase [Marinospirillum celere]
MLLFISDLHLQEERPRLTRGFFTFLEEQAPEAEALYILGDFFDVWIGDDAMTAFHQEVAAALKKLTDQGTSVYLMHGNRDFALGQKFCRQAGCTLLPDPSVIVPFGEPLLLMHGDLLCTDDVDYQRMRRVFRNPLVQFFLLKLPISFRRKLAAQTRKTSKKASRMKAEDITDAHPQAINDYLQNHAVKTLIHGHTHRPDIHDEPAGKRYVLGDWSDDQGWKLVMTRETLKLLSFHF